MQSSGVKVADSVVSKIRVPEQVGLATRKKLVGNVVSLYILQGLNYVVPVLVLPFLVRVLGIERYGKIAFAQAFAMYFVLFTEYGFNYSATRRISLARNDAKEIGRIFSTVLTIKLGLAVIGFIILVVVSLFIPPFKYDRGLHALAYIAVVGSVLFPAWLFQGLEKMTYISIVSGIGRILSTTVLFMVIRRSDQYALALGIQSLGVLLTGVLGQVAAYRVIAVRFQMPKLAEVADALREGWHLFVSYAAIGLYTNTNVVLVGMLAGTAEAGMFSAAEKLIRAMQGLIAPISQSIFPHIASLAHTSREQAMRFISKCLKVLAGGLVLPCVFLAIFAPEVSRLCFGSNAGGTVGVIRAIAFLPLLIGISNVLGIQTMVAFQLDKQFSRILLTAGILNVIIACPMILWRGAQGAGMAVTGTEIVVAVLMWLVLRRTNFWQQRACSEDA